MRSAAFVGVKRALARGDTASVTTDSTSTLVRIASRASGCTVANSVTGPPFGSHWAAFKAFSSTASGLRHLTHGAVASAGAVAAPAARTAASAVRDELHAL